MIDRCCLVTRLLRGGNGSGGGSSVDDVGESSGKLWLGKGYLDICLNTINALILGLNNMTM